MARVKFELKEEDINKLIDAIKNFEGDAEDAIGKALENEVADVLKASIENLIPVSNRNKPHAKYSAPFADEMEGRLSIYIHTKKKWHYLYFPDEGEGTSKGQAPHNFMGEGVERESDNAINILLEALMQVWNNN